MKNLMILLILIGSSINIFSQEPVSEITWLTNMEEALAESTKTEKVILLEFTGSDWCSHCKRIEKEFFTTEEFKTFAKAKLILMKADFPMKKANKQLQSKEEVTQNEALIEKYNPKGTFPTVVVLRNNKVIGRLSYPLPSAKEYLKELEEIINK